MSIESALFNTILVTACITAASAQQVPLINAYAGTGNSGFSGDNGPATLAQFYVLQSIASVQLGGLYLVDGGNFRIRKVDPSGIIATVAGTGEGGSPVEGPAVLSPVLQVYDIAVNSAGTLYMGSSDGVQTVDPAGNVLDSAANQLRKFYPDGIITTVAGTGAANFSGDGGPANHAALNAPSGLAIDIAGNIYISDSANHRIRKVSTNGAISTFAGQADSTDPGDGGPALQAYIDYPTALAVSCSALYVADGDRVRSIGLTDPLIAEDVSGSSHPGESFSISGCNLAQSTASADPYQPLPAVLAGVHVTLNGIPVSLSYVSPTQIIGRIPGGLQTGEAAVTVANEAGADSTVVALN